MLFSMQSLLEQNPLAFTQTQEIDSSVLLPTQCILQPAAIWAEKAVPWK